MKQAGKVRVRHFAGLTPNRGTLRFPPTGGGKQ